MVILLIYSHLNIKKRSFAFVLRDYLAGDPEHIQEKFRAVFHKTRNSFQQAGNAGSASLLLFHLL